MCRQGLLQQCNALGATYLFQTDKHYDVSYDSGDKSIQCGRHVDIFKLWLMWKAKVFIHIHRFCGEQEPTRDTKDQETCRFQGSEGFGSQVDKCLENAEYLYDQLQKRPDFELVFKHKVRLVI